MNNEIIRNYDFMMSDEEQDQYVCPVIMDGYVDTTDSQIKTADDVYRFVERLKAESERVGRPELVVQLDDAMHLGSSGLEILGAIRQVLLNNRNAIEALLGAVAKTEAEQVINFVDKAFGR